MVSQVPLIIGNESRWINVWDWLKFKSAKIIIRVSARVDSF